MRSIASGAQRCLLAVLSALALSALAPAAAPAGPVVHHQLACLHDHLRGDLRRHPAVTIRALIDACDAQLQAVLGERFADLAGHARRAIIAALAAQRAAPYGSSFQYSLAGLLGSPRLDCAGYAALTWHLLRLAGDPVDDLRIIGWDGSNAVGNHAQIALVGDGPALIIDPTIGLVARVDYRALTAGARVDPADIVVIDHTELEPDLHVLTVQVVDALYLGAFRPFNALYDQPYPPGQGALAARPAA